jgi:hypothetical protein
MADEYETSKFVGRYYVKQGDSVTDEMEQKGVGYCLLRLSLGTCLKG